MRIVIVGGYGVFGRLTAQLLRRDGHDVWIAGRNAEKARRVADAIGAMPLQVDFRADPEPIFALRPDAVIDAAGPFQAYGDDAYALARRCIAQGCHYLDLSDASGFTQGIGALDAAAKTAGVAVLSGASSVPGLSSAVVADLAQGFDPGIDIDIAILPGNRAPRGLSVIESILDGVGRPAVVRQNGGDRIVRGWTEPRRFDLALNLSRRGYFVDVPDIRLLPDRFGARGVMFRAGLELGVMNGGLRLLAALRRLWDVDIPRPLTHALYWASRMLYPFGSDRGGMQVSVSGCLSGHTSRRTWTLVAEAGDGPFVPGVMCRAILRRIGDIGPGARPCLAEVSRAEAEAAMSDLAIQTRVEVTSTPTDAPQAGQEEMPRTRLAWPRWPLGRARRPTT